MPQRSKAKNNAASRPVVASVATAPSKLSSQPSVRTQVLFTPPMLAALELQVDSGELYRLADLCDQMMADDRICELLEGLADDVLGCELTFEQGPRINAGDAEKGAELDADWAVGFDDDELTSLVMWTLMCGVGFAKIEEWREVTATIGPKASGASGANKDKPGFPKAWTGTRLVPVLKWWHPKHFCYDQVRHTWQVRDAYGVKTDIAPGDQTWVIATRRGEYRPWANGVWRELKYWYMLKRYAIQDWGIHSEKAAKVVVTTQPGTTSPDRVELSKEIFAAAKDAVITLPVGCTMQLLELKADTRMIYEAQVNAANEAAAICINGQNLTTKVDGGSHAAAQVHETKENRKVRYVAKLLGKALWTQVLTWWAQLNFGDRALAPYPRWHTEPPDDVLTKATALKMLGDALTSLKTAGYKLSPDYIEEEYGLDLEELPDPPPLAAGPGGLGSGSPAPFGKPKAPAPQPAR